MINRTNFLEPTQVYIDTVIKSDKYNAETIKDWFNADLIQFSFLYTSFKNDPDFIEYNESKFVEFQIPMTIEEIVENFKHYSPEMYSELIIPLEDVWLKSNRVKIKIK